ncbi:hypothetical protein HXX76_014655 [Chlamydomonas incerta]|uniref:Guanylate cyclase domain-containing protein n=1 Tax=Chlamydomonas incerta TaxID=51695 RepID=A0A835SG96_CHLIN|nr:hypothetical protein HXX76_014655 [Chlamydomonas incerta]|eukprot:KAG2424277.1 hypothetical protein HXX76_014655 [Chlamydomonas incerta]
MTKRLHGAPAIKAPEPPGDTSVRKPWQLKARNRQAVTEWTWQDKSDFWAALGQAPKDPACLPPLTAQKGFFVAFRAQARAAMKMVRKFPSVLVLPLLVLALLIGLGIFGVRTAANDHVKSSRVDAEAAALKAANAYSLSLDAAILPVLTLGTFIRETPSLAALGPAFPRIAVDLLKQARNSAALQLKLVPFGIVRAIFPPLLDLSTLGLNLFSDPTRRQEALQTVELKSVWMAGPLSVPPEERRVLIARNPVFMPGVGPDETWGNGAEGNTNCSACYDNTTRTKFWGFAAVYIAFDDLTTGPNSPLLPLTTRHYLYRLTKPAAGESGQAVVLSESSPAPPGGNQSVSVPVYLPGPAWLLEVYPEEGYRPSWEAPLIVVVVVVATVISIMMFVAMVNHRRLLVLLRARLPGKALDQLRMGRPFYDYFPAVTILDCSVVKYYGAVTTGGEPWASTPAGGAGTDPREVVTMLNDVYKSLDAIAERHGLHKVETYNDSYVCVGGCPEADGKDAITWACHVAHCARDMVVAVAKYRSAGGQRLQLQIGLHSGPVSAAVIDGGKRLPRYCIFGGTVATATDLRVTSQPQAIHVSRATAELLAEAGDPMVMLVPRGLIRLGSVAAAGGAAAPGGAGAGAGAAPASVGGLMYTSWLQVDLMAGAYGGAYGARAPSTDLVARHMDDDEISLDGLNIVRKALRQSGDGEVDEEEEVDPEKQAAALGPLGFMHPFFGSFRRRVQPGDWEVVADALGLQVGDGQGDGGSGGVGVGGGSVTVGMVAAASAAAAARAAGLPAGREAREPAVVGKAGGEAEGEAEAAEVAAEVQLGRPAKADCAAGVAVAAAVDGKGSGKGGAEPAADDGASGSIGSSDGSSVRGLGQRRRSSVPVSPVTAGGGSGAGDSNAAAAYDLPAEPSAVASPTDAAPISAIPSLPAPAPMTPTASGFDERASVLSALDGYSLSAALNGATQDLPAAAAAAATAGGGVVPGASAPAALREKEQR